MAATPEEDFATSLATRISRTLGTDIFRGRMRSAGDGIPHDSVFVRTSGGPPPLPYGGQTAEETRFTALQVIVRGDPEDYDGALTTARSVRDQMHDIPPSASYIACRMQQSEPLPIGEDETGATMFSLNFELWHDQ
jgi:hypothetical protein